MRNIKQVIQYRQDGTPLAIWPSIRSVAILGSPPWNCLVGVNSTAHGFKWQYFEGEPIVFPKKHRSIVYNIKLGLFIGINDKGRQVRFKPDVAISLNIPKIEPFEINQRGEYKKRPEKQLKYPRQRKYLAKQKVRSAKNRKTAKERELRISRSLDFWAGCKE